MQTEEILQTYANRQTIRRYTLIGFFATWILWFVVGLATSIPGELTALGMILVGVTYSAILWRYWRCPVCERPLGRWQSAHCPHCGTRLVA